MRCAVMSGLLFWFGCLIQVQAQVPTEPTEQQKFWNAEYAGRAARGEKFSPNEFLARVIDGRPPGTALDISMGQGRNAVMLAEHGWNVTGFDISDVAIDQATTEARRRGLKLNAVVADGATFDLGLNRWDLVASIYVGVPRINDVLGSLKPGGIWVVEAFHRDSFGGGFRDNELFRLFEDLMTVIYYEDGIGRPDLTWSYPGKDFRFVRLVARKEKAK